jgi:hypothetical protein
MISMEARNYSSIATEQLTQKLTQVKVGLRLLDFEIMADFPGEVIVKFRGGAEPLTSFAFHGLRRRSDCHPRAATRNHVVRGAAQDRGASCADREGLSNDPFPFEGFLR